MDVDVLTLNSLDPGGARKVEAKVAGPAGLLVAKLHKIEEREGTSRAADKDALDVLRLLRGVSTVELADRMRRLLADVRSAAPARRGLDLLAGLFGRGGEGTLMAARAVADVMDAAEVRLSCEVLASDLVVALRGAEV